MSNTMEQSFTTDLEDRLQDTPTLTALLAATVAGHGSRPALRDGEIELTYDQFAGRVRDVAATLVERGVAAGDRVAIVLPNCWQYAVAYFAVQAAGAIAVLVNIRFTGEEIAHVVADSGATLVVTDAALRATVGAGHDVVLAAELDTVAEVAETWRPVARATGDAANLLYTSGTTGRPKGAIQTHGNLVYNAMLNRTLFRHTCEDRTLIAAPMFHATGLNSQLIGMLSAGGLCVLQPRFVAAESLKLLAHHRITFFAGVATMLHLLASHPDFPDRDLRALRLFVLGGAPVPEATLDLADSRFPHATLGNVWGLTEATSIATYVEGAEFRARACSVGRAVRGVEVRVWDELAATFDDEPDAVGELCVRGPIVTAGYWQNPTATHDAFRDGWLHTGDIGAIDADGYVRVLDRSKDMIIRGGENVYSLEVENVVASHPDVSLVAVFGRPDDLFGERVCAAVVPETGSAPTPESLRAHAAQRLADYKVPVEWQLLDELPMSASGKVLKRQLAHTSPTTPDDDGRTS